MGCSTWKETPVRLGPGSIYKPIAAWKAPDLFGLAASGSLLRRLEALLHPEYAKIEQNPCASWLRSQVHSKALIFLYPGCVQHACSMRETKPRLPPEPDVDARNDAQVKKAGRSLPQG